MIFIRFNSSSLISKQQSILKTFSKYVKRLDDVRAYAASQRLKHIKKRESIEKEILLLEKVEKQNLILKERFEKFISVEEDAIEENNKIEN